MIKNYIFDYNLGEAEARFKVDTEKFTVEHAMATLNFFTWDWDDDEDPIDEVIKKYASKAIRLATFEECSLEKTIEFFNNCEGYGKVDGSIGVTLTYIDPWEFDDSNLEMKIS